MQGCLFDDVCCFLSRFDCKFVPVSSLSLRKTFLTTIICQIFSKLDMLKKLCSKIDVNVCYSGLTELMINCL